MIIGELRKYDIQLDWHANGVICFKQDSKFDLYCDLNRAARIIYKNRKQLREIKQEVLSEFTTKFLKGTDSKFIANLFTERAKPLLAKVSFL